jgi:hypothetical protein
VTVFNTGEKTMTDFYVTDSLIKRLTQLTARVDYYTIVPNGVLEESTLTLDGMTLHGVDAGVHAAFNYTKPGFIGKAEAAAQMLKIYQDDRFVFAKDATPEQVAKGILNDGLGYYDLKRLTEKQKTYVLNWIFDSVNNAARSRFEAAHMVCELLGGRNNAIRALNQNKPFAPSVGATGKVIDLLDLTDRWCSKLLGVKADPDTPLRVLASAGVDTDKISLAKRLGTALTINVAAPGIVSTLSDLARILKEEGYKEVNVRELSDALIDLQRHHSFTYTLERANAAALWLRLNQSAIQESPELEDFIDEVIKRLAARYKSRAAKK